MFNKKKWSKKYRETHKKELKEKNRLYRLVHKEHIKEYNKQYVALHIDECKLRRRNWFRRYRANLYIRLVHNLRERLRPALKGNLKIMTTLNLVGCSIEFLKGYLEKQFQPGMSWQNYGVNGWEVDHIRPCASFDLRKASEQKQCFHYTNLQPLWESDNRVKGKNYVIR